MPKPPKKTKGVFERVPGSGIYYIRFRVNGKDRWERAGTYSQAVQLLHHRKSEALKGEKLPTRKRTVTFAELAEDALEYSRLNKRAYIVDKYTMPLLKRTFGHLPAEAIAARQIEKELARLAQERRWKPASRNRHRSLLSLCFRLGIEAGKVSANPVRTVKRQAEANGRTAFLSTRDENALRAVIRERYPESLPVFDIALHTGMRKGELYGATWEDVDLQQGILTIPRSKSGKTRVVYLDSVAVSSLKELRQRCSGTGAVVRSAAGKPLKTPKGWFPAAVRLAGLPRSGPNKVTFHTLRHTFASRLVMSGASIAEVKELMGHSTIQMTMRYAHLEPDRLKRAVARLQEYRDEHTESHTVAQSVAAVFEHGRNEPETDAKLLMA